MRALFLRILVATLTFSIGVTSVFVQKFFASNSDRKSIVVALATPAQPQRKYERGPAGSATYGSFITLNSSDGMNFTKWSVLCDSPEKAARELMKRIKGSNIVTREDMLDETGCRIGEKILAQFPGDDRDGRGAVLIWTENKELFEVHASSVQNILEYRKDFNR